VGSEFLHFWHYSEHRRGAALDLLDRLAEVLSDLPLKHTVHYRLADGELSVYLVLEQDDHETALAAYRLAAEVRQSTPEVWLDFHVTNLFWPDLEDVLPPAYAPYPMQRQG
jgi:hypothetical protein